MRFSYRLSVEASYKLLCPMFLRLIPAIPCGQALAVMPVSGNLQYGADNGSCKALFSRRIAAEFSSAVSTLFM